MHTSFLPSTPIQPLSLWMLHVLGNYLIHCLCRWLISCLNCFFLSGSLWIQCYHVQMLPPLKVLSDLSKTHNYLKAPHFSSLGGTPWHDIKPSEPCLCLSGQPQCLSFILHILALHSKATLYCL